MDAKLLLKVLIEAQPARAAAARSSFVVLVVVNTYGVVVAVVPIRRG